MGLEKTLAAVVAAALAFLLAGSYLTLMAGPFEGWAYLALFAAIPAAVLAPMPLGVRIFCVILGLLALAVSSAIELGGPDSPLIVLPWIAICFAGSAVVAELSVRALQRVFRSRSNQA